MLCVKNTRSVPDRPSISFGLVVNHFARCKKYWFNKGLFFGVNPASIGLRDGKKY